MEIIFLGWQKYEASEHEDVLTIFVATEKQIILENERQNR